MVDSASAGLAAKTCKPCEGGVAPLAAAQVDLLRQAIDGWEVVDQALVKTFDFADYYATMAFVNAVAWIAHREDHHPDLEVGYCSCRVRYATHAIGGLSENDFICAAKVDRLLVGA